MYSTFSQQPELRQNHLGFGFQNYRKHYEPIMAHTELSQISIVIKIKFTKIDYKKRIYKH